MSDKSSPIRRKMNSATSVQKYDGKDRDKGNGRRNEKGGRNKQNGHENGNGKVNKRP